MEFKQYPSYKKSGVEWLGGVPEHWVGSKFKYIFQEKQHTKNMNLPFGAISFGSVVYKEDKANLTDELKENYQEVLQGEFLVNPLNLNYDLKSLRTALSKIDVVVSSGYFVLKLKNNTFNKRYLEYLLYIFDIRKMKTLGAGIRQTLTFRDMAVCDVAIPSACEQTQIASFLDYETFRIDNLIAKQEKLIELLEEQRKSIISHAVTKGLNPNAPMKDSGVEWLGEVPEHWDVAVVKRAFIVKLGKMLQPDQKDETDVIKKYLKASNLTWDGVKDIDNEMWFSKNDLKKLKLEIGDLLVAEGGDVGKSCIFDSNEEFYYQNSVNRVRGQKNNANEFLYYWLFTLKYSGYIDILCNKSTIAHFTAEKLNETILLLPDSVEQNEIIAYLERENGKINQLILKQQSLIEKLKEYRASIISHAVTGKIDVREFGA